MYWERSVSMSLRRVYGESTASLRRHRPQRPSSTATIVYGNSLATMVHGHISWPNAGAHYRLIYWWVTNCDHNSVKSLDEISGPLDALSVWSFCMIILYELCSTESVRTYEHSTRRAIYKVSPLKSLQTAYRKRKKRIWVSNPNSDSPRRRPALASWRRSTGR